MTYTELTRMQDKVYSLNLVLKLRGCLKFMYKVQNKTTKLDQSELDHAEPNQGMYCQTIMCKQIREQGMNKVN